MLQHSRQEYSTTGFVNKQIKCSYKKLQLRVDQQNPEMIMLLHISVFRLLNTVSILNKIWYRKYMSKYLYCLKKKERERKVVEYFSNIQNKIMKNSSRFSPNLHTNKNSPLLPNPNTHTEKKERKKMGEIYLFTILPIKKLLTVTEPPHSSLQPLHLQTLVPTHPPIYIRSKKQRKGRKRTKERMGRQLWKYQEV